MRIIQKSTGEVLAEVVTNHSWTLDEACDFMGIKVKRTEEDFDRDEGYDFDDLDLVF